MKRYVIDDTGGQFFVCDDLDAANIKCHALKAEGRDAYVAHGDSYAEIKEVERQAQTVISTLQQQIDACETAAAGLTGEKIRGDIGYSRVYAKVYELRQERDNIALQMSDVVKELQDAEAKIAELTKTEPGNGRADESGPTYDNLQVDPSMTADFKHVGGAPIPSKKKRAA